MEIIQDFKDDKLGLYFGDYATYRKARDIYWKIMNQYGYSPRQTRIGETTGTPDNFPSMSPEEYTYWYPYQMLMQRKYNLPFREENA